jgi:hypothetical protein
VLEFKIVRYKNLLSVGNWFIEIPLNKYNTTCVIGANGASKCCDKRTKIKLLNNKTNEVIETTMGEFYELQRRGNNCKN